MTTLDEITAELREALDWIARHRWGPEDGAYEDLSFVVGFATDHIRRALAIAERGDQS